MSRNRLYGLLASFCAAGYAWIYYSLRNASENDVHACMFKKLSGIPCPSCGSAKSVMSLMQGDIIQAVLWNPMGLFLLAAIAFIPLWIAYDLFNKKRTLYVAYRQTELFFSRKRFAIPVLILLVANWAWNIYKGL